MDFQLKPAMLLGAATTAAAQIEGGATNNNWYRWYQQGNIKDGSDPATAVDHFDRWQEDVDLMARMGLQCCCMSIEWSRVEPEDGVFDEQAISRYRQELQELLDRGIRPLLTLHHFSTPLWLEERGAFEHSDNITYYLRYVRRMTESFGDLVSEYITFHAPNAYACSGWFTGAWPPGRKSPLVLARVMTNLAAAHIEAYGLIRRTRLQMGYQDTRVSFAPQLRLFTPRNGEDPVHRFWASRREQLFQGSMVRAMCTGRTGFPIGRHPSIVPGRYCDFHAVDYAGRATVGGPLGGGEEGPADGLGREICPAGITEVCQGLYDLLPLPIYITGSSVCDREDSFRTRYIAEHLQALCGSGLPVERYYYGSFCDGWEWTEGLSARCGLVSVEGESRERRIKRSGEFYQKLIAQGGVSEELWETYCGPAYPAAREAR